MFGAPVRIVDSGGIPVTDARRGVPIVESDNRFGAPVTVVDRGGVPVSFAWPPRADGITANDHADFVNDRYFAAGARQSNIADWLAAWGGTFTRASAAGRFDSSGLYQSVGVNVLRLDHDPITKARLGLLIENARTLINTNAMFAGGTAGIVGSGGVFPTDVTTHDPTGLDGVSKTLSFGTIMGAPYMAIRFNGTPNTTGVRAVQMPPNVQTIGQTWTQSNFMALTAGSLTNVTGLQFRNGDESSGSTSWGDISSTPKKYTVTQTLSVSSSARQVIRFNYVATGVAVDFTLLIALPQTEQAAFASSPILTSGSSITRATDVLTRTRTSPTALSVLLSGRTPSGVASGENQTAWSFSDGSASNQIYVCRIGGSRLMNLTVVSGGLVVASINLGAVADNTDFKLAFRASQNDFQACLDGVLGAPDLAGAMPVITNERFGRTSGGSYWFGHIRQKSEWTGVLLSDAALQALTY